MFLLFAWALAQPVINEIHFAPADPALEFVELFHSGATPIPLHGWALRDGSGTRAVIGPPGVVLGPGAHVTLVRNGLAFAARWPGVPYLEVSPWPSLNDVGDRISLEGPGTTDEVPYLADWSEKGRSLERRDPAGPSWHPVNWSASIDPSGATPGRINSVFNPDRTPPSLQFADRVVPDSITAWFSEPVESARLLVDGIAIDSRPTRIASDRFDLPVESGSQAGELAVRDLLDLFGNRAADITIPIAVPPSGDQARLGEVLMVPRVDPFDGRPDQVAFVEIVSLSSRTVSLRGVRLATRRNESGARRVSAPVRGPAALPAGGRIVLYDARPPSPGVTARYALEAAYGPLQPGAAAPLDSWPFGRTVEPVHALDASGVEFDAFVGTGDWYDGEASGRSLERTRPAGSGSGAGAWSASEDPAGATPGRPNSSAAAADARAPVAGDLAITEILYEADPTPGNPRPEFVEVLVTAPVPVDPNGLRLVLGSGSSVRLGYRARAWEPGTLFVAHAASTGAEERRASLASAFPGLPLPADRVLPLRVALRNEGDELILVSDSGEQIDRVVYAPSQHHPGLLTTRGVSLERVDPWGSGTESTNWRSSVSGATPGSHRAALPAPVPTREGWLSIEPRVFYPRDPVRASAASLRVRLADGPGLVDVEIHDLWGRRVRYLTIGQAVHDETTVYWDGQTDSGSDAPAGPYVVLARRFDSRGVPETRKGVVVVAR